ncbi:CocE/NonD family hydrolase [Sphingopyxis indica]|uniref:CocE/NonD family hydrolase n=1 Tax=Sphingopyxis indica TaxID=436663 RepID=UPI0029390555|nr:CocE/NonD family hydrolase [Sphingopyxis indica]
MRITNAIRAGALGLMVTSCSPAAISVAPTSAPAPVTAGTATTASYPDTVRTSLYVPVRDGTRLAVNIYRPATGETPAAEKLPGIFVATPYRARFRDDKGEVVELADSDRLAVQTLLEAGYVVAVADIRGKGASFGTRRGFQDRTEARDSYDLIEWLAKQDYTTEKVGMIGCSYLGGTTFHAATAAPPSLKAVFVGASDLDKYGFVRRGGIPAQFNTRPDEPPEVDLASIPVDADTDGSQLKAAVAQHAGNTPMAGLWYGMPYRDSVSAYTGNRFWEEVAVYRYLDAIRKAGIATYFWGNWHDEPTAQSILSAANMPGSKFLAGPGDHCVPPPGFDFTGEIRRYFDHYLKGVDNGIEGEARAKFIVENQGWMQSDKLPGEFATAVPFYLAGGKSGTAKSVNDGTLLASPSVAGSDRFTVDYNVPDSEYFAFWAPPMDAHGLSYTSAELDAPMTLVGYPVVHVPVSSSTADANVFVYLDEIDASGKDEVIAFGRLALSHRKTGKAPFDTLDLPWHSGMEADVSPLPAGQKADLAIDLTPISRVVPAGHRLRVTITGADPRQRNLAEIKQNPAPVLTVWRRGGAESARIDLPVANPGAMEPLD